MISLCILVPACSVSCCLVYSCFLSVSLAFSSPDVIKDYYLSLRPRLCVLVPPCCVHRDRRPDLNCKRSPFTPFCFPFLKVFCFVSVPRQGIRHSSFRPSPRQVCVGVQNQNQNQNQNQLYSPSVCKHTRNLLWFLRSSWYIHTYI